MNKLETAYAQTLVLRQRIGEIEWFAYEAFKLRLADNTFLTPDFAVMLAGGEIEIHETKGFMEEDANIKLKVAASLFPFKFLLIKARANKAGGGWDIREI